MQGGVSARREIYNIGSKYTIYDKNILYRYKIYYIGSKYTIFDKNILFRFKIYYIRGKCIGMSDFYTDIKAKFVEIYEHFGFIFGVNLCLGTPGDA